MMYKDYLLNQFNVRIISKGKDKGRVCLQTPCINYTLSREDWRLVKEKLLNTGV